MDGAGMDGINRFNREGNIRWCYGRTVVFFGLKTPLAKNGDLYGALRILGQVQLPKENGVEIVGIGVYRGYFFQHPKTKKNLPLRRDTERPHYRVAGMGDDSPLRFGHGDRHFR